MAEFKFNFGERVKHSLYGLGQINGRITIKGKILLKDTYTVLFPGGTFTVKEKALVKATIEEWKASGLHF